jgi:hypothetical protein
MTSQMDSTIKRLRIPSALLPSDTCFPFEPAAVAVLRSTQSIACIPIGAVPQMAMTWNIDKFLALALGAFFWVAVLWLAVKL